MTHASLLRFDVEDPVHGQVACAALLPEEHSQRELPCCLMLYGGGGSRESLADLQPSFESAWSKGELPPCIIATPDVGPWSFYLDDRARGFAWESFIVERFVAHVQALAAGPAATQRLGVVGMSMGGYGALKLAFARPQLFAAVGAVSPMPTSSWCTRSSHNTYSNWRSPTSATLHRRGLKAPAPSAEGERHTLTGAAGYVTEVDEDD